VRNVRIRIAYDGSKFYGWQRQSGFETVQEALEEGLEALVGARVVVHGSGRTDAGVHAMGQVASFHVDTKLEDERLLFALNHHVPEGVVVRDLETCADDFHAQYSARGKRYLYLVRTTRFPPAFGTEHCLWTRGTLDLREMRRAAQCMVGEHDFSALASAGSPRKTNVRKISGIHIVARRDGFALIVQGNGFLYNMVRAMVGTLLQVGQGQRRSGDTSALLQSKDRSQAGPTASASGLYLRSVLYNEVVFAHRGRSRDRAHPGLFP
jgi:tRNA pseudouridine38-40 synthase